MKIKNNKYNNINRRRVISLIAGSIAGISGCMDPSASPPSQSILIRNESTTRHNISLILRKTKNKETIYNSIFSIDPNEEIREENVVSVGNYEYVVRTNGLESKDGI